jgi:cytochrome oxidase assembly protein ShyY1
MYRFMWRPWWIVSHIAVLALIVAMISACLWQVRRLDEKKDRNRLIEQNTAAVPVRLGPMIDAAHEHPIERIHYRRVQVTGRYDTEHEVAIRNRTLNGAPGRWIATPLVPSGGGQAVLVVRGFAPQSIDDTDPPFDGVEPPDGEVTVVGWVQPTQTRGAFGATDPAEGTLHELARVDVGRVEQQYGPLAPFWLELAEQQPPTQAQLLTQVPLPDLDEGPHLGYAAQWAIFTLIALIGYPLVLRKVARQQMPPDDEPGDGPPGSADEVEPATSRA